MSKRLTKEEKDLMVEAYLGGKTQADAGLLVGVTGNSCRRELKKRNIPSRPISDAHRKYQVDDYFFDVVDTEEKAYWLGFITADGCVCGNDLKINLKSDDAGHLKKFLSDISSDYPIHIRNDFDKRNAKSYEKCTISIRNKNIISSLGKLGVVSKKSFDVKPCELVPNKFESAYWRGVIDGDGSFTRKNKDGQCNVTLYGSEFICAGFKKWASSFVKSKARIRKIKSIFGIEFSGNTIAPEVLRRLYGDATVYLDRKYEKAMQILEEK